MGPRSIGTVLVEERLRVQPVLAGLGPEPIAAAAARSEGFCFALRVFLIGVLHAVRIDRFRAAVVAAAGNGGLHLEPFEPRSAYLRAAVDVHVLPTWYGFPRLLQDF